MDFQFNSLQDFLKNRIRPFTPRTISLSLLLTIPFVVQVFGIVGLVGYLSYRSGQQAVEKLAHQLLVQTGERVTDRINSYLLVSEQVTAANRLGVEQGTLDLDDPEQLRQQLWQQMRLNSSLPTNGFWRDDGTGLGYTRINSQEVQKLAEKSSGRTIPLGSITYNEITANMRRFYSTDPQGKPLELFYVFKDDFRNVPWYRQAKSIGKKYWTSVSLARVIPVLQTFVVEPIYSPNGKFEGVFTANYFLSEISLFLEQLKFSPRGQIFIIEPSGDLVSTSVKAEASGKRLIKGKFDRLNGKSSNDRLTREVTTGLIKQFGNLETLKEPTQLSLKVGSHRQFVHVTPYRNNYGLNWQIVTIIPEEDFLGEIQANLYDTGILCALALLGSVGFGIWTSRRISRSLVRLTDATKAFAEQRHDRDLPATAIVEVEN